MSKIINWIEYFTADEMIKRMDDYIEKTADDMIIEIKKRREKNFWIKINKEELCTM